MKSSKQWLSYSNVIATLALFVALGGSAWALSKNSVGSRELQNDAVRSSEIKNETIKGKDVKPDTLGAGQITDGSLGSAELADGAVGSGEITDGAVTALEIANDAITSAKIAADAITSAKIASNSVTGGKIASGAVGAQEIANGGVGTAEIANGSIDSAKVADGGLTGDDVAGNSITGAKVDESSLGTVPDATAVGGRAFVFGSGNPAALTPELIATLPALGAELQTDGDVDTALEIELENTRPAGAIQVACDTGNGVTAPGGAISGSTTDGTLHCLAWNDADPAGPGRSIIFCVNQLFGGGPIIRCEVLRG